ncbi:hypothetical protein ACJX0J_019056, partial [Zea mays]
MFANFTCMGGGGGGGGGGGNLDKHVFIFVFYLIQHFFHTNNYIASKHNIHREEKKIDREDPDEHSSPKTT